MAQRDMNLSGRVRDDITLAGWAMYLGWSYRLREGSANNAYSFTRGRGSRDLWFTGVKWLTCRVLHMSPWRDDYKEYDSLLEALVTEAGGLKHGHVEIGLASARQDIQWAGYGVLLGWKVTGLTKHTHAKFTREDGMTILYDAESSSWFVHRNGALINTGHDYSACKPRLVELLAMAGGFHDDGYYVPPKRSEEKEMFSKQRERIFLAMKTE